MAEDVKIELGFSGGNGLTVATDAAQWEQLQASLSDGSGGGWSKLTYKDGATVALNLDKVVWVRVATPSRSIGFGKA
jgi:hypothetical protein